ncbi:MAG: UDP-galactopyranose mutase [Fibrobacter sp.]|nr:UDP-galactopyranose mutase [Fibrobacter sp.]
MITEPLTVDYLCVGAGITCATIANLLANQGYSVLVCDRRQHVAGNCYTEQVNGIHVHKYGAHIFHTSDEEVYNFITSFGKFHPFINSPIAITKGEDGLPKAVNMPFNMNTFAQIFPNCVTPADATRILNAERKIAHVKNPRNLEEQAISMVGRTIYSLLIRDYTEKQWGCKCTDLPPDIIKRLPLRMSYDNNYFNDTYQVIPDDGYTAIIQNMLTHPLIRVETGVGGEQAKCMTTVRHRTFYSGCIDEFYDYEYGHLDYRTVKFTDREYKTENKQGNAVFNYTTHSQKYTRTIEHKWFNPSVKTPTTIVSTEYPAPWKPGAEPYYPINNSANNELYRRYVELHNSSEIMRKSVKFVGRLGTYSYMDMDDAIKHAFAIVEEESNMRLRW